MKRILIAGAVTLVSFVAQARPSPYPPVTTFEGDRYSARTAPVARTQRAAQPRRHYRRHARQRRTVVRQTTLARGMTREVVEALPPRLLAGVVAPLAAKARQIVADCGSTVISGVRHTYVAGTGGRLSLHASGRAVDIRGNPGCIYAHLRGWPGGYSTDYARPNIRHVHVSYAPHGPEWGKRFVHYTGHRRPRHRRA